MCPLSGSNSRYSEPSGEVREAQALDIPQKKDLSACIRQDIKRPPRQRGVELSEGLLFRPDVGSGDVFGCIRANEPPTPLLSQLVSPQVAYGRQQIRLDVRLVLNVLGASQRVEDGRLN